VSTAPRLFLDFDQLARLEPRLRDLEARAKSYHRDKNPNFCGNAVWYGYSGFRPGLKEVLCGLVGYEADRPGVLETEEAYDVAYDHLFELLPDCRGRCACSVIMEALVGRRPRPREEKTP
jgi:hypothetical protein